MTPDPVRKLPGKGYDPHMTWGKSVAAVTPFVDGYGD